MLKLIFQLLHNKNETEHWITGSLPQLGSWELEKAKKLKIQTEIDSNTLLSQIEINIPLISRENYFQYSYLRKQNEKFIFEQKKNRKLKINSNVEGKRFIQDEWGESITKSQGKIIIRFKVHYNTNFGQNVYITGNHPELGKGNIEKAIKMNYMENELENWLCDASFSYIHKGNPIEYRYVVKSSDSFDSNNQIIIESLPRKLNFSSDIQRGFIEISDSFFGNLKYHEFILTKSPFTDVFFKPAIFEDEDFEIINLWENDPKELKIPVQFRVISTNPFDNFQIRLTGSSKKLGNWDPYLSIPVSNKEFPIWKTVVWMEKEDFPFEYKYIVCPRQENISYISEEKFDHEFGGNRKAKLTEKNLDLKSNFKSNIQAIFLDGGNLRSSQNQIKPRIAGISIPVFSIRSKNGLGVGEFNDIELLADWASRAHFRFIQILPINDTRITGTWDDSYPYSALSSIALHPIYINLDSLDLSDEIRTEIENVKKEMNQMVRDPKTNRNIFKYPELDYPEVIKTKMDFLRKIFLINKEKIKESKEIAKFIRENSTWLPAYSVLCALADKNGISDFNLWDKFRQVTQEEINFLMTTKSDIFDGVMFYVWIQFELDKQLSTAVKTANRLGIVLMGDLPIGVDLRSADVWTQPSLFNLDCNAGAPPDYFSKKGQNWFFPTYNWMEMERSNYKYWINRLACLEKYFQALRVDHIIGWFRIWEIPNYYKQGLMGHFNPSIPIYRQELIDLGIQNFQRLCQPYLSFHVLEHYLEKDQLEKIHDFLEKDQFGNFQFKPDFDTQSKIYEKVEDQKMKEVLFALISEVCLLGNPVSDVFYPRYDLQKTLSFQDLDFNIQKVLLKLSNEYFYSKQESLWKQTARKRLPLLTQKTKMLIIAEDLGFKPQCLDPILKEMQIPGMKIERMSSNTSESPFDNPKKFDYMSMTSTSTHDSENIREWWEITDNRKYYWNKILHNFGDPPKIADIQVCTQIIKQNLESDSMICIIPIQDWFSINPDLRIENPKDERINYPPDRNHHWKYQIQIPVEDLINEYPSFTNKISRMIDSSDRYF
eukprot:Anaeramoba_ignava/a609284_25.p1 GENE.a609284_25~~a609284_25.p1  ORF type:complete len:1053 (+),score=371.42 a609284_25:19-3177(+)